MRKEGQARDGPGVDIPPPGGNESGNASSDEWSTEPLYPWLQNETKLPNDNSYDPVWAYSEHPLEQLHHHTFEPADTQEKLPKNYVYCSKGGATGPRFEDSFSFDGAPLPGPPMSIAATVRTEHLGRFQVFLGWGEGKNAWDAAEFRLTAFGNLQYGINDGFAWHNVEANPPLNLINGQWHHVAMVRDKNGAVDLFLNGTRVGYGLVAGNPRVPMNTARAARTMYGLRDLAFHGNVTGVYIYDRALRWWEVAKVPFVPCREKVQKMTRFDLKGSIVWNNLGGYGHPAVERARNMGGITPDQEVLETVVNDAEHLVMQHERPAERQEVDLTGPSGMRFESVAEYGGVVIDLLVTNTTPYEPKDPLSNGIVTNGSSVGHINILSGTSVGLRFEFVVHKTFYPAIVDNFYFVFMDIDSGPFGTGRESLTFTTNVANFYIAADSSLHYVYPSESTNLVVWAGDAAFGDYYNNPEDANDLDDEQEKRSVVLVLTATSGFETFFNSTPGLGGRDISFAGWSTLQLDSFNTTIPQGPPQTVAEKWMVDPGGHTATGDEQLTGGGVGQ